jgi:hypothetical protein
LHYFADGLCKLSVALVDLVISVHVLSLNTTAIFAYLEAAVVGGAGMDYVREQVKEAQWPGKVRN